MMKEAKRSWERLFENLSSLNLDLQGTEEEFINLVKDTPVGVEAIVPGDYLAFTTIWNSMSLVKHTLESKGIYVNNKEKAVNDFNNEFGKIKDAQIISDLHKLWVNWHKESPSYEEAKSLTRRLFNLAKTLNKQII